VKTSRCPTRRANQCHPKCGQGLNPRRRCKPWLSRLWTSLPMDSMARLPSLVGGAKVYYWAGRFIPSICRARVLRLDGDRRRGLRVTCSREAFAKLQLFPQDPPFLKLVVAVPQLNLGSELPDRVEIRVEAARTVPVPDYICAVRLLQQVPLLLRRPIRVPYRDRWSKRSTVCSARFASRALRSWNRSLLRVGSCRPCPSSRWTRSHGSWLFSLAGAHPRVTNVAAHEDDNCACVPSRPTNGGGV